MFLILGLTVPLMVEKHTLFYVTYVYMSLLFICCCEFDSQFTFLALMYFTEAILDLNEF